MRIYTRTGDGGETGLFSGERVPKDDPRVEAYGTVDELNSFLGLVRAEPVGADIDELLARIQDELFVLGADLATPPGSRRDERTPRVGPEHVRALEAAIDHYDAQLPPLRAFILPAGPRPVALLQVARAVARRAERRVVAASRSTTVSPETIRYLNRLSDLLFVLARTTAHRLGTGDAPWHAPATGRPAP
ncbi:MAG: ATP:cob(I)alamin adenosyltransferase [Firmicutes bacterium ZCTH02-B6]|nr:MAG: ATP:cob(I)alamin adenosyltransferase [Firmicutes bacterium ZCTH02-B6]